ncbi:MAG: lysophospholipid acyltransferase family protein [Saprospiraceae bacterium]
MTVLLIRIMVGCFAMLPMKVVYVLSDMLYLLFRYIVKYRRKVIQLNLRNSFPKSSEKEIDDLTNRFYRYFSDLILETMKGFSFGEADWQTRFIYKNPEIFDSLYQQKKSAILLGSHYGNWEWGGISFPLAVKHKVIGAYKPIKNRKVETYLNDFRKKRGLHLTNMKFAGRAVIENKNEPVIFVFIADQTPSDVQNAHWLTFLNQDTPFLHGAAKLASKTGYPVFHYKINRMKRGFYEVEFEEICGSPESLSPPDITSLYAKHLERMISQNPPFWLWSHRRWKRKRPNKI